MILGLKGHCSQHGQLWQCSNHKFYQIRQNSCESKFQIKATGANVHPNPTLTFTLRSTNGLEIDFNHDHGEQGEKVPMLPLSEGTGKWIQVRMQHSLYYNWQGGSRPILLIIMTPFTVNKPQQSWEQRFFTFQLISLFDTTVSRPVPNNIKRIEANLVTPDFGHNLKYSKNPLKLFDLNRCLPSWCDIW